MWNILRTVEGENGVPLLTASSTKKVKNGEIVTFYNQPVVNFMSTDLQTNTELRKTTLASLGVKSGSAVLRVRFKPTEVLLKTFLEEDALLADSEAQEAKVVEQRITDAKMAMQLKQQEDAERRAEEATRRAEEEEGERLARSLREEEKSRGTELKHREMESKTREMASSSSPATSSSSPSQNSAQMNVDESASPSSSFRAAALGERSVPMNEPPRKKFEVVVEPPGPPGLMRTFLEGGMIDQDHQSLHEALRKQQDEIERANKLPEMPCPRDVQVFAPASDPFDPSSIVIPDDFFEVYAADLSQPKSSGGAKTAAGAFEVQTKAMKEKQRLQKLSRFKKCFIRFRFPDRLELQAAFYPQEKTSHLTAFLRTQLVDEQLDFYLFTTPPTTNLDKTKNIRDQGFLPAALVHVGLSPGANATSPFLKPEVLQLIKEKTYMPVVNEYKHASEMQFVGASVSSSSASTAAPISAATSSSMDVDQATEEHKRAAGSGNKGEKKVPKWFSAGLKSKK